MDFLGIFLDKQQKTPLYVQLYRCLAGQIRAGGIAAGEKLPGKRSAAAALGVSVNTVNEAYQQLAAEGYVAAKARSGFVACRLEQMVPPAHPPAEGEEPHGAPPQDAPPKEKAADGAAAWRYTFSSSGLDAGLFPLKTWNRLLREVLAQRADLFVRGEAGGDEALRAAIARYLRGYRGVRCHARQLVAGAGLEVLFGMLARLLAGKTFALENPGYPKTARILHNMGLRVCAAGVDEGGMEPAALARSGAQVAYLTPSHQFPTGAVMPATRRSELLQWAAGGARLIVEDDYDSEFRFDGRPLPCLQGMDRQQRVVYAGTFTRSLAPGLRAAYLVLPPWLQSRWQAAYGEYACTVSRPEQHTLARLLDEGHFARSLNRARSSYRRRRDTLLAALQAAFPPGGWQLAQVHTGPYFVLRLPGQNALGAAARVRGRGLLLRAVDEYRLPGPGAAPGKTADALVVGYGGLKEEEIPAAAAALAAALFGG